MAYQFVSSTTKSKVSSGKNLRKRSITRVLLSTDLTGPGGGPAKLKIELLLSSFFHFAMLGGQ